MIARGYHWGTQVIQGGISGHYENGACYKIINFWSIIKCNTPRMTKFWAENSFLGSYMRFGTRKGVNPRWPPRFHQFLLTFVNSYVEVTWICIIGDFKIDS